MGIRSLISEWIHRIRRPERPRCVDREKEALEQFNRNVWKTWTDIQRECGGGPPVIKRGPDEGPPSPQPKDEQ